MTNYVQVHISYITYSVLYIVRVCIDCIVMYCEVYYYNEHWHLRNVYYNSFDNYGTGCYLGLPIIYINITLIL